MRAIQTAARWLFRGLIIFCVFITAFLGVVYLFMQRDPAQITDRYLSEISRKSGLKFDLGSIDVTLLPLPSIAVSDLLITGKDLRVSAAWLSLRPNFLGMLAGNFQPASITVLRPRVSATLPVDLSSLNDIREFVGKIPAGNSGGAAFPDVSRALEISQGQIDLTGASGTALRVNGLQADLRLDAEGIVSGSARMGALRSNKDRKTIFSLENFEISGAADPLNFREEANNVSISGNVIWPGYIRASKFEGGFESSAAGWTATGNFSGLTALPGGDVDFSLSGRAVKLADSRLISFRALEFGLGADSGHLDVTLGLPAKNVDFSLSGKLIMPRASLTEWLGFARNLNPGLRQALDNVLDISIDFSMNSNGLQAPRIDASCMGARFVGEGSVADFKKPVVFLDLKTKKANLGLAVPESVGHAPLAPYFPHETLTPMPGEPLKPGETGIDYDVRLAAETLLYGPLKATQASLRVHPGKMDAIGLRDVLLTAKSNFYGGKMDAECILGVHPGPPIIVTGKTSGINAASLARDLKLFPFRQGTFQTAVNVSSKGKELKTFLAALRGTVSASGQKAAFADAPKEIFEAVSLVANLRGASLRRERPVFDAKWQARLKSDDLEATAVLEGPISMAGSSPAFANLPGTLNGRLDKKVAILPPGARLSAKGAWTLSGDKISLANGSFEILDQKAEGNIKIDCSKRSWDGSVAVATPQLEESLRKFGFKNLKVPAAYRKAAIKADFSGNPDILRLANVKASLGASAITGRLSWQTRNSKPFFDFTLNLDLFDWKPETATHAKKNTPLDFSFLKDFNASGELKCQRLSIMSLRVTDLRASLRLDNGKLSFGPATGRFYGCGLQLRGTADFNRGIGFNCVAAAHDFDLGAAARDRKIDGILTGQASVEAHAQGRLANSGDLPKALNGSWSFSVMDGSWQSRKNGQPQGSPTRFSKAMATGIMDRGVLRSKNFSLIGKGLEVTGGGWINLNDDKLNCDLNVNMKGLPDFPLRLYGTIKKPETSIGAGRMVANALGNITSGVANTIVGIFKGAWNIFR